MALDVIADVTLDMQHPGINVVHVNQYDSARKVKAQLQNGGVAWSVPSGAYGIVMFKKTDNKGGFYDTTEFNESAVSIDNNDRSIVYAALDVQTMTVSGNVDVQIAFFQSGKKISTFSFRLQVHASPIQNAELESNWIFNILAHEMSEIITDAATISPAVITAWLEAHVSPETGYVIDNTLTVQGAAADAKAVGDTLSGYYGNRVTLTGSDDLNTLTKPGVYYYADPAPAHAPFTNSENRVLVIKSTTEANHAGEWQVVASKDNVLAFRRYLASGWNPWSISLAVSAKMLASTDDLNNLGYAGVYTFNAESPPANAPKWSSSGMYRLLNVKGSSTADYAGAWQLCFSKTSMLFRAYNNGWSDWLAVNNDVLTSNEQDGNISFLSYANDGKILTNTLVLAGNADASCTDYIRIPDNANRIEVSTKTVTNGTDTIILPQVFFFDENKSYISRNSDSSGASTTSFVIPFSAKYVRVNQPAAKITSVPHLIRFHCEERNGAPVYQNEVLPYNAIRYHAKWDSLLEDNVLRRVDLGNVDDDPTLPMYAYEFCPNRFTVASNGINTYPKTWDWDWDNVVYRRPKILILGGLHGNEKCTPMDIYTIAKRLKTKDYNDVACKFDWFFIPLVNPWGYSHAQLDGNGNVIYDNTSGSQVVECTESINAGMRLNSHGQDINRDWSDVDYVFSGKTYGFKTPEAQLIKEYVLDLNPDVFIDAHQNHTNQSLVADLSLVLCYANTSIDTGLSDPEYINAKRKIYRYIDVANADTNETVMHYSIFPSRNYQTCRASVSVEAATVDHYFAGVTVMSGQTEVGNTLHQNISTPYSLNIETSEICYNFSGTGDWYNQVACTISSTYLWNIIKRISELF